MVFLSACQNSPQPLSINAFNRPVMAQKFSRQSAQADSTRLISEVASAFHDAWRAGCRLANGSYELRIIRNQRSRLDSGPQNQSGRYREYCLCSTASRLASRK